MPLASMTAFARADGSSGAVRWTWEMRSVNGKGLELRLRLPPGHDLRGGKRERAAGDYEAWQP